MADLVWFADGVGVMSVEGRHVRFAVAGNQVWVDGRVYTVETAGPRRAGSSASASSERRIKSQMPGTVLSVRVAVGDEVEAGQTLLLMESMKMEMAVEAPRAGRVATIACAPGQMVEMGAVLVELAG